MRFQEVTLTRAPLLVLDPREWFASWHGTAADLPVDPDDPDAPPADVPPPRVPAVVRPSVTLTVTAEPMVAGDPRWPFAGEVELALIRTPSGLLAFFGRVRSPNGPLRRLPLRAATARLRVTGPGFAPVPIDDVAIPGPDGPATVIRFDLLPDPSYPFPTGQQPNGNPGPTLLVGDVMNPDGSGIPGAAVAVTGEPDLVPTTTNERGGWILVLDRKTDRTTVDSPIDVTFTPSGGSAVTISGVEFQPGQTNRITRTSLRGVVRLADGRGVAGALVSVAEFPVDPTLRPLTRPDGTWVFCLGVGQPNPTGPAVRPVTVRIEAAGRPPKDVPVQMTVGGPTQVDAITV